MQTFNAPSSKDRRWPKADCRAVRCFLYLGGIRESFIDERENERRAFWRHADKRLDELALDPEARAKVEAAIDSRVRRVTPENQAEFDAAHALLKLELAAQIAKIVTPA